MRFEADEMLWAERRRLAARLIQAVVEGAVMVTRPVGDSSLGAIQERVHVRSPSRRAFLGRRGREGTMPGDCRRPLPVQQRLGRNGGIVLVGAGTTVYYVSPYYEFDAGAQLSTVYCLFNGQPIATKRNGVITYLHHDQVGSLVAATDANGNEVAPLATCPWVAPD